MALTLFRGKKRLVSEMVSLLELSQLDEVEAKDYATMTYFRGVTHAFRTIIELIDKDAVPMYAIIRRGKPIVTSIETFEENDREYSSHADYSLDDLALDWTGVE